MHLQDVPIDPSPDVPFHASPSVPFNASLRVPIARLLTVFHDLTAGALLPSADVGWGVFG